MVALLLLWLHSSTSVRYWSNVSRSAPNVLKSFPFTSAAIFQNFSPQLYLLFLFLLFSSDMWLYQQLVTWDSTFSSCQWNGSFYFLGIFELSIG